MGVAERDKPGDRGALESDAMTSPPAPLPTLETRKPGRFPRFWFAFAGALVTGLAVGLIPTNTACSAVGAGLLAFMVLAVADMVLWDHAKTSRGVGRARAALFLAAAIGGVALTYRSKADVFETAFGLPPPPGVVDRKAEQNYGGGPGDVVGFLTFRADRATIDRIVAPRQFAEDRETMEMYDPAKEWDALCREVLAIF